MITVESCTQQSWDVSGMFRWVSSRAETQCKSSCINWHNTRMVSVYLCGQLCAAPVLDPPRVGGEHLGDDGKLAVVRAADDPKVEDPVLFCDDDHLLELPDPVARPEAQLALYAPQGAVAGAVPGQRPSRVPPPLGGLPPAARGVRAPAGGDGPAPALLAHVSRVFTRFVHRHPRPRHITRHVDAPTLSSRHNVTHLTRAHGPHLSLSLSLSLFYPMGRSILSTHVKASRELVPSAHPDGLLLDAAAGPSPSPSRLLQHYVHLTSKPASFPPNMLSHRGSTSAWVQTRPRYYLLCACADPQVAAGRYERLTLCAAPAAEGSPGLGAAKGWPGPVPARQKLDLLTPLRFNVNFYNASRHARLFTPPIVEVSPICHVGYKRASRIASSSAGMFNICIYANKWTLLNNNNNF